MKMKLLLFCVCAVLAGFFVFATPDASTLEMEFRGATYKSGLRTNSITSEGVTGYLAFCETGEECTVDDESHDLVEIDLVYDASDDLHAIFRSTKGVRLGDDLTGTDDEYDYRIRQKTEYRAGDVRYRQHCQHFAPDDDDELFDDGFGGDDDYDDDINEICDDDDDEAGFVQFYLNDNVGFIRDAEARSIDWRRGDWSVKQALTAPLKETGSNAGLCSYSQESMDALVNYAEEDTHYFALRHQETGNVIIHTCQIDNETGACSANEQYVDTGFSGAARMKLVGSIVFVAIGAEIGILGNPVGRSGVILPCSATTGTCGTAKIFASEVSAFNVDFAVRAGSEDQILDMVYVDTANRLVVQPYDYNNDQSGQAIVLASSEEMTLQRSNTCCGDPRALFSVAELEGETIVAQVVEQEVTVPESNEVDTVQGIRVMRVSWASETLFGAGTIESSETVPDNAVDYNELGSVVSTRVLALDMTIVNGAPFLLASYSANLAYSQVDDPQLEGFDQSMAHEAFTVRAWRCEDSSCSTYQTTEIADSLLLNAGGLFTSVLSFDFPYHIGVRVNPNTNLPHISIATLNGNPILLDCLDVDCLDASVVITEDYLGGHYGEVGVVLSENSVMVASRANNGLGNIFPYAQRFLNWAASPTAYEPIQCTTDHVAEVHNSDDRLYICTKLPTRPEGSTQYYTWAPVGGKLRSAVHDNSNACVDCPWVSCESSSTELNDYSNVVNRY